MITEAVGPNAQFAASQFPNTHRAKPMKETQKQAETFNKMDIDLQ